MPPITTITKVETPRSLRALRSDLSIGDVSKATGISPSHVSRIFNGKRSPSLQIAQIIANFLGCTLDDLTSSISEAAASIDPRRLAA